jgi:hypothetical protein
LSIPPGKKSYHVNAKCTYPNIPTEGISVFAYINHAHLLGRKLWTSLERNNKYAHDLGCDAQYDFDLQQIIPFEQHVKLFKSDRLYANCVYDSTGRTEVTEGGDETTNEMCINFLVLPRSQKHAAVFGTTKNHCVHVQCGKQTMLLGCCP